MLGAAGDFVHEGVVAVGVVVEERHRFHPFGHSPSDCLEIVAVYLAMSADFGVAVGVHDLQVDASGKGVETVGRVLVTDFVVGVVAVLDLVSFRQEPRVSQLVTITRVPRIRI